MSRLPTLFVSHGAPSFALEPGAAGAQLAALGESLPRPKAVLVVSPHWMTREVRATSAAQPQTVHDFAGFAAELYTLAYPAPGHPALAMRALDALRQAGWVGHADPEHGLDHGAWVPLRHLYPRADVPVFQVSMPARLDTASAYRFGQALAPLAEQDVLIVGSGSLTHNLYEFQIDHGHHAADYAIEFAHWIRDAVARGDHARLVQALEIAPHARRAHPTAEHFLPLAIAAGAAGRDAPGTVVDGGIVHGVLAMDSFLFG